MTEVEVFW